MSMADFGSFLGGISQGQQAKQAQAERAQYLLMLEKRQKAADDDRATSQEAAFDNAFASDPSTPTANDPFGGELAPGGGPGPMPARPQTPQPGQASVPMQQMQPGAGPMPGAPGGPPQPAMRPPVNGNANGNAPPQPARPMPPQQMPPQGQQMPPGGAPPMQPPQGQPAPPQTPQTPQDGYAHARKVLEDAQAKLSTPVAQRVLDDPQVKKDTEAYHAYINELKAQGIGPGKGKPTPLQQKRLVLLHDQLGLSAASAAKHLGADDKAQMEFGVHIANTFVQEQTAKNLLQRTQDTNASRERAASARGAGKDAPDYEDLDDEKKSIVEGYIKDLMTNGKFLTGTGYNDPLKRTARAEAERRGWEPGQVISNKATDVADAAVIKTLTNRQGVVDETSNVMRNLEPKIREVAKRVMAQPGMSQSMRLNDIIAAAKTKYAGNGDVQELANLMQGWKGANARLMAQNTGAGGTPVFALNKSDELMNMGMPLGQLDGAIRAAETERNASKKGLGDEIAKHQSSLQTRDRGPAKGAGKGDGNTAGFTGADGTDYSDADVAHVMKATGMTRQQVMEKAGVK
jgi:hypothetical protein